MYVPARHGKSGSRSRKFNRKVSKFSWSATGDESGLGAPSAGSLGSVMSAAIVSLTALDFLGLGVPASVPSLGELLQQGKNNLDAWWIIIPTFLLLTLTTALLTFIGEALRDAFDTRKS